MTIEVYVRAVFILLQDMVQDCQRIFFGVLLVQEVIVRGAERIAEAPGVEGKHVDVVPTWGEGQGRKLPSVFNAPVQPTVRSVAVE